MRKRMRRGLSLLLAAALLFSLPLYASASIRPEGSVWDKAQVLDESVETTINALSTELFRESGAEIAVMAVDFLGGKDIDDFTYDTFNDLGIGSQERNNGVLLVLAIAQDDYYVMVGSGIDDYFTGAKLQAMLDEYLEPDFAKYEYSEAVKSFCDQMYLELKALRYDDRYSGTEQEFHAKSPPSAAALLFGPLLKYGLPVLLIVAAIALAFWLRSRWGRSSASAAPASVNPEEGAKPEGPSADQKTPAAPLPTSKEGCGCSSSSLGCGGLVLGGVLLLLSFSAQSVLLLLVSLGIGIFALAFLFGYDINLGGGSSGGGGSGGTGGTSGTAHTPTYRHDDDDDDDPPSFSGFSGGGWSSHSSSFHSSSSHSSGFSSGGSSRGGGTGRSGGFSSGGSTRGGGAGRRK